MTTVLNGLGVEEADINIIMLKSGVVGDAECDFKECDKAIYNRMSIILKGTMQNVSEGGYSVSWNMEAVKCYYNALCNELGLENVLVNRPKIRNRSNLW